jgi:hypothetical protein
VQQMASDVARRGKLDKLQNFVAGALLRAEKRAQVLVDRLDEGWVPDPVPTGIIGGLIVATTDLSEANVSIHGVAFVRDNIFRALAERVKTCETAGA